MGKRIGEAADDLEASETNRRRPAARDPPDVSASYRARLKPAESTGASAPPSSPHSRARGFGEQLGIIFDLGNDSDENSQELRARFKTQGPDGKP
jgi:hypothetical protein